MSTILTHAYHRAPVAALLAAVACSAAGVERNRGKAESFDDNQAPGQCPTSDGPLVQTPNGKLRGRSSPQGDEVDEFRGIRYAAPPVGELRLASPVASAAWAGEQDAKAFGAVCPQINLVSKEFQGDEDCLSLNVYRPAKSDSKQSLPVMIWIHGGSFKNGSGSEYDPYRLVKNANIIVVTINYRLGPFGFLPGNQLSGDYGLQDQQAAFRWVQANIGAFGGDPKQVTIAGESAGAASVCAHLTLKSSGGLFSRAIIQSGSCASYPLEDAKPLVADFAKNDAGCALDELATCMRAHTDSEFAKNLVIKSNDHMVYAVLSGSESDFLPKPPLKVVKAGEQQKVPVLIGGIADEMGFFMASDNDLKELKMNVDQQTVYMNTLRKWFKPEQVSEITNQYPLSKYFPAFSAVSAVFTDSGVYYHQGLGTCVTAVVTAALSKSASTYSYELDDPKFAWKPTGTGASHTSDLPYLFDMAQPLSQPLTGNQVSLAATLVNNWGNFIKGNAPSEDWKVYAPPTSSATAPGSVAAPSTATETHTRFFTPGAAPADINLRAKHQCEFWDRLCGKDGDDRMGCPYPEAEPASPDPQ